MTLEGPSWRRVLMLTTSVFFLLCLSIVHIVHKQIL